MPNRGGGAAGKLKQGFSQRYGLQPQIFRSGQWVGVAIDKTNKQLRKTLQHYCNHKQIIPNLVYSTCNLLYNDRTADSALPHSEQIKPWPLGTSPKSWNWYTASWEGTQGHGSDRGQGQGHGGARDAQRNKGMTWMPSFFVPER